METNATSLNASAEAEMSLSCLPDVRGAVRRGWWRLQELFRQCQRIPESGLSETGTGTEHNGDGQLRPAVPDETLENCQQNNSIETNATSLSASSDAEMSLPCPPNVRIPVSGQSETCTGTEHNGAEQLRPAFPEVQLEEDGGDSKNLVFSAKEAFPDMRSLPRLTGGLRAFSDLSPDKNDEVSTNEDELQRKHHLLAKRLHVKEGSGWRKLMEKVEKESTADKSEVKEGFKELLQCARQIVGQSAEPDVAETVGVYLFEIFKSVEKVGNTETMKLRSLFGPFPASAATKACTIVNRITSWLPVDVIKTLSNQVWEEADVAATVHEFGRGIKFSLPTVETVSDVSSSEDERQGIKILYRRTKSKSEKSEGLDATRLLSEVAKYFNDASSTVLGLSLKELTTIVFDVLTSPMSDTELQNNLFELLGCDRLELIQSLLQNRDKLLSDTLEEMAEGEYPPLNHEQREKLGEFFQHNISKAAVDYTKQDMKDIRAAVDTMLERIRTRVNSRGIFKIARIVPSGSMAEETAIWKFTYREDPYLEFDFLAMLENAIEQYENPSLREPCQGCITIVEPPVESERLGQYYKEDKFSTLNLTDREVISDLFLKEINHCLTLSCDCLSIQCNRKYEDYAISFRPSSGEHARGCESCVVDMPTGTLHVNTEIDIAQYDTIRPNKCSLIFHWTSKTKTLSAQDKQLLQEPQPISSLPIYVDFLPALESLKPTPSGAGGEHDYFIVPKHCNVCRYFGSYCRWRKSCCMAEIHAFTSEMSDKHRKCYQIMKFLSGIFYPISNYHVKTVLLRHHTTCSDTTDECVDCVLGMFRDLLQAYKTEELLSYQSNLNILEGRGVGVTSNAASKCEALIKFMYSVSVTDTWKTFIPKIRNARSIPFR